MKTWWGEKYLKEMFIDRMGVWFLVNMAFWAILGWFLIRFLARLKKMAVGIIGHTVKIDQPLNMEAYKKFILTRKLEDEDIEVDGREKYRKLSWEEPKDRRWQGNSPQVEITVDETNGFLVKYFMQYNKNKGKLRGHEVGDIFMEILRDHGLIPPIPRVPNPRPADAPIIKFEETEKQELDMDAPITSLSFLDEPADSNDTLPT